jgi:2-isopropylmalate synthase
MAEDDVANQPPTIDRDDAKRVLIFDTTLRDGEQSPGATLNADEKLEVADVLVSLGVDVIEAGFPAASPGDFEAVRSIAARSKGVTIAGLARAHPGDIERAAQAIRGAEQGRIHTFIATSDVHLQHKLRMTREQVLERVASSVALAKSFTSDVEFSCEDATRSDWDYLVQVFGQAIRSGATTLNIPDTVGYTMPDEYIRLIAYLRERVEGIEGVVISTHCHDDLGMATANTLAAISAGARQVEVTVNGIGERAGNTSLEEVVMALRTRGNQFGDTWTGVQTERLTPASRIVASLTGIAVAANKAIVGANAFAHEAGIHQDGVLKERTTYEIMDPASVGWQGTKLVLGKHSGRAGFRNALNDIGLRLDEDGIDEAYHRFSVLADRKKTITAADLIALVSDQLEETSVPAGEGFRLARWNASLGNSGPATASVVLSRHGDEVTGDGEGNGPVDAFFAAIDAATGLSPELETFNIDAVTEGEDAQGRVRVRVRHGGTLYIGDGLATDIVEASARAYLAAVSKAVIASEAVATVEA